MAESALPIRRPNDLRQVRYDEVSSVLAYVGFAAPNATTSDALWRIQKIVTGPGNNVSTSFADGDAEFDNVWDNRAGLTYP